MRLYAESSAVLCWLLGEANGEAIGERLRDAEFVLAGDITAVECERALVRAVADGRVTEGAALSCRSTFRAVRSGWHRVRLSARVLDRAGNPFPVEPVRTIDALHLAGALAGRAEIPDLTVLSLDRRVRENALALGFSVTP